MHPLFLVAWVGLAPLVGQVQDPPQPQEPEPQQQAVPEPEPEPPLRFRVHVLPDRGAPGCDLGEQAVAINARGAVVGSVCLGERAHAAWWAGPDDGLKLAGPSVAGSDSFAVDLDDEGTVLGYVLGEDGPLSFLWTADTAPIWLALPDGAVPLALGAERQVAFSYKPGTWLVGAVLDAEGQPIDIASPERDVLVRDLNPAGVVTGIVGGSTTPARAFRWSSEGGLVELAVPEGFTHTHGNAITDTGLIVGLSRSEAGERATLWPPDAEPTLLPYARAEHTQSAALGVNAAGWVVGYEHAELGSFGRARAVVWIDGVAWELDRMLLPHHEGEVQVSVAWEVNERGQIAARGRLEGVQRALRLDPQ